MYFQINNISLMISFISVLYFIINVFNAYVLCVDIYIYIYIHTYALVMINRLWSALLWMAHISVNEF